MGRWLNADAFASTGQGLIGNNMFAYCGNNPVMRIDADGKRWEYVIEDVVTESEDNQDGSYSVTTSITYSYKQIFLGVTMYESPKSETADFSYTISSNGVVIFDNNQADAPFLTIDRICDTLADEMYAQAKEKVDVPLSWRTAQGLSSELYWHYISYSLYILRENAEYANIGGMHRNKPGFDSNAFIFECM